VEVKLLAVTAQPISNLASPTPGFVSLDHVLVPHLFLLVHVQLFHHKLHKMYLLLILLLPVLMVDKDVLVLLPLLLSHLIPVLGNGHVELIQILLQKLQFLLFLGSL